MTRFLIALLLLVATVAASAQNLSGKPFIAVRGHAERQFVPDIFPVTVTVHETSMDADKAQNHVEALAADVMAAASTLKVADADLDVGNLSISPETKYDSDKEVETFLGNTYEREFKIRFHNLADVRTFLDHVPTGKNVQIATDDFAYSKAADAKKQLMDAAIADAKDSAERMARAVGKKLLTLHNVSDRPQGVSYSEPEAFGYSSPTTFDTIVVTGTRMHHSSSAILKEGVISLAQEAYVIYLIGD